MAKSMLVDRIGWGVMNLDDSYLIVTTLFGGKGFWLWAASQGIRVGTGACSSSSSSSGSRGGGGDCALTAAVLYLFELVWANRGLGPHCLPLQYANTTCS